MNAWLTTITDTRLREDTKKSLLVSGGCIASMFDSKDVNDFDVYIQDMNVLLRLAEYYCPGKVLDGRKKDKYIQERYPDYDPENPTFMDTDEEYASMTFVRINNLKPDQVKLDIDSAGVRKDRPETEGTYSVVFLSQNAISLSDKLQIVLRFSGTPEQIHKNFDFVHATNYYTFDDGLVTNIAALESIITKELRYQGSLYPLTSIVRMKKFLLRNWKINAGEIVKILFQVSLLDLRNVHVLEEQLIGVDIAYFGKLIEILQGVSKDKMSSSYFNKIVDRVFNQYDEDYETKIEAGE